MNMNISPKIEELRDLIKNCNDSAGHHVLWIAKDGEVHLTLLPKDSTPARFQQAQPDMQIRYETFQAGNDYVGPDAADDSHWIHELYEALTNQWDKAKGKSKVEYVDCF